MVYGHSGWLGPTGGKTNVLNEKITFFHSVNFKLLSQGNSVNNYGSILKLVFSVRGGVIVINRRWRSKHLVTPLGETSAENIWTLRGGSSWSSLRVHPN